MAIPEVRHLVVWEAQRDNGWMTLVIEQRDGTFIAWAGADEAVGVDYLEDCPQHAEVAAMFALKRKSGHAECSDRCSTFEMRSYRTVPMGDGPEQQ